MKTFELGRNALRFYEESGLLTEMKRTDAGYREFEARHIEDLKFILEAKKMGFTLSEIKELLEVVRAQNKMTCGAVATEISSKVKEIDAQLETLQSKKLFLQDFLQTCGSKAKDTSCEIIAVGFSKSACCE